MPSFLNALVFISLFGSIFCEFKCPMTNSSEPIDGAYRDPQNCGIYYHCINGIPYLQTCPPGLHFIIRFDFCKFFTCVDPKLSDCEDNLGKNRNKNSQNVLNIINQKGRDDIDECEPNKNETVANEFDCRVYYHCVNGIAFPQRCPTGYFFSPKLDFKRCVTRFCVPLNEADCPIDGQWSSWSNWTECEGSCNGGGVRRRYRECNNPPPLNNGDNCVGNAVEEEFCDLGCYITPSFMVSLSSSSNIPAGTVNWTQVDLNSDDLYNPKEANLNIKQIGMYFFALTGTISSTNQIRLTYSGAGISPGLRRDISAISEITLSREALFQLSPLFSPTIRQRTSTNFVGSSGNRETSWLGFEYETENYFFAATDIEIFSTGTIDLPVVQLRGFSKNGNTFKSSASGMYYISYGISAPSILSSNVQVYLSGFSENYRTINGRNVQAIPDTWTKNYILVSNQNAPEFSMFLSSGTLFSSAELQVYMTAFKLNSSLPMLSVNQRAASKIETSTRAGSLIRFSTVDVDNFGGWNISQSKYTIQKTGTYYISTNIPVCRFNDITSIFLRINSLDKSRMARFSGNLSTSILVTKSVLLRLTQEDTIQLFFSGCISNVNNGGVLNIFQVY